MVFQDFCFSMFFVDLLCFFSLMFLKDIFYLKINVLATNKAEAFPRFIKMAMRLKRIPRRQRNQNSFPLDK